MKYIWLICCYTAAIVAQAQPAQIGTLFSSPQERNLLDSQRSSRLSGDTLDKPSSPAPAPPPPSQLQLNGVVKRSGGQSTVWLNQTALPAPDGRMLQSDHAIVLTLRLANGRVVRLKPGQHFDPASNTVVDDAATDEGQP